MHEEHNGIDKNTRVSYIPATSGLQDSEAQQPLGPFIAISGSNDAIPATKQ